MKSWSLCESNVPELLDLAPYEAGNLKEVYERYFLPGHKKKNISFAHSIATFTKLITEHCLLMLS